VKNVRNISCAVSLIRHTNHAEAMLYSHAFDTFKDSLKEGHKGQLEELEQLVRAWEQ
jgi:hypothetical protein